MRFLVDEAVSPRVAEALRGAGHDAVHVRDLGMTAAPDSRILETARADDRVVITQDQDYGTLLAASGAAAPSVIRLRLRDGRAEAHSRAILANLPRVEAALRDGALIVLRDGVVRIRSLPMS